MASTITITCPECDKTLKAPSDVVGKKIRCKSCGATFPARAPGGKAPAAAAKPDKEKAAKKAEKPAEPDDPFASDTTALGVREEYLGRRCPDCANAMEDDDVICLHCGMNTVTRERTRTRLVQNISGFDVFKWLLPGILCTLLVIAVIGSLTYYWGWIDRSTFGDATSPAWYDFLGGLGCKVYATVMGLGVVYLAGRFAVMRLCINYWPPEVELKMGAR